MKKLAIVDDDGMIRKAIVEILRKHLPDVEISDFDSFESISHAFNKGTIFDIIVMDGKFPEGELGPWYTGQILTVLPETVVVGFSTSERLAPHFKAAGAKYFINKCCSYEDLVKILKKALQIE